MQLFFGYIHFKLRARSQILRIATRKIGILCAFLPIFFPKQANATLVGNLAQPCLQTQGVVSAKPTWWDIRAGYFGDYVYNQPSHDAFPQLNTERETYDMQIWTQAGMVTLNLRNRVDLYGIIGGLRLQNSHELFSTQQFTWGVGGKVVFLHVGKFRAGCDFKYLEATLSPQFFESNHLAYNVTTENFSMQYSEIQAAVGLSYLTKYISPYASATYLVSELSPTPATVYLRIPSRRREVKIPVKSISVKNNFGLALGATLIDHKTATLSAEWRAFNQNSIDITGEIRF